MPRAEDLHRHPQSAEKDHGPAPAWTLHPETQIPREVLGKYYLFLTPECPPGGQKILTAITTEQDMALFVEGLHKLYTPSRRSVYQSPIFSSLGADGIPIFKRKARMPNDPNIPGLNIERFTTDVFHEMKTAYALADILERRAADLPKSLMVIEESRAAAPKTDDQDPKVTYLGPLVKTEVEYSIDYRVQKPWGAIINREDETQKYGVFEYLEGTSARAEVASYGGWNYAPEDLRKLLGQMHMVINKVANICVDEGLEPWDFGVHQLIYSLDRENRRISLGIVDTEEFNFVADAACWPEAFRTVGLPPVILFGNLTDSYDD